MATLVLSVSYRTGCYRHIKISDNATLYDLHTAILDVFEFFDDHMHAFFMNNHAWDEEDAYYSPNDEDLENFTNEYRLADFKLGKGSKFLYIFDFGDEHRFQIKVLRTEDEIIDEFQLIKSVGESPEQYPGWYDEEY